MEESRTGKPRTGHLFQRGGKGSAYYVSWRISLPDPDNPGKKKSKSYSKRLSDKFGAAITTIDEARQAQREFMQPMALGDEAKVYRRMTSSNSQRSRTSCSGDSSSILR
jgi:hypothetical protein